MKHDESVQLKQSNDQDELRKIRINIDQRIFQVHSRTQRKRLLQKSVRATTINRKQRNFLADSHHAKCSKRRIIHQGKMQVPKSSDIKFSPISPNYENIITERSKTLIPQTSDNVIYSPISPNYEITTLTGNNQRDDELLFSPIFLEENISSLKKFIEKQIAKGSPGFNKGKHTKRSEEHFRH